MGHIDDLEPCLTNASFFLFWLGTWFCAAQLHLEITDLDGPTQYREASSRVQPETKYDATDHQDPDPGTSKIREKPTIAIK